MKGFDETLAPLALDRATLVFSKRAGGRGLPGEGTDVIHVSCRRNRLDFKQSRLFAGGGFCVAGDTARAATSDEVKDLRREASALKEVVAELTLENRLLKKT